MQRKTKIDDKMKNLFDSFIEYDRVLSDKDLPDATRKIYEYFKSNALLIVTLCTKRPQKEIEGVYKETAAKWLEANRAAQRLNQMLNVKIENKKLR